MTVYLIINSPFSFLFYTSYYYVFFIMICIMNEDFLNKWKSQVKKGTLALILLTLLKEREKYGYELMEEISF